MLSRRKFLNLAQSQNDTNSEAQDKLIFIFQRGAADGLNLVVPYGDEDYYRNRPTLALGKPNSGAGSVIDLDGFFGLNPDMAALLPIFEAGNLAFIHACGSQDGNHSHFSTQAFVDRGTVDEDYASGWLARYVNAIGNPTGNPFQSIAMSLATSPSLRGAESTVALNSIADFNLFAPDGEVESIKNQLSAMYAGNNAIDEVAQASFLAIDAISGLNSDDFPVENDAQYPSSAFANKLKDLAILLKSNLGVEVASVDIGGWDSHDSQATMLSGLAQDYANSLAAFYTDMGTAMDNITIVTLTEFGRRVAENGSGGTDHGTGNVAFVMGKAVNGGVVYRDWPGLATNQLVGPGDLAATTDFRTVLAEIFAKRMNFDDFATLFPDFTVGDFLGVVAAT